MCKNSQFGRYKLPGMLFLCAERNAFSTTGQVKSIGLEGVSYDYIYDGLSHPEEVIVEIFTPGWEFHISGVACTVTSDRPVRTAPCSIICMRRCSLVFNGLTYEQERAIWVYTNREALREEVRRRVLSFSCKQITEVRCLLPSRNGSILKNGTSKCGIADR